MPGAKQKRKELTVTRIFDAPLERVFKAWTDPEIVARWWGPNGFTNPVCEMDARPGGAIRIVMRGPDGIEYPMTGVFREISGPGRLVFTTRAFADETGNPGIETLNTVTFARLDGRTRVTVHAVVVRSAPEAAAALAGMGEGWSQSLDRLGELLANARELVIARVFDAPRELVFRKWIDPEFIPRWWGPRGYTTTVDRMDVRPGGIWRFVQHDAKGNEYVFTGVYYEIEPPQRLISTFNFEGMPGHEALVTDTFEEYDGKTKLTSRMLFQSAEDLDGYLRTGGREGMAEAFDRFEEILRKA